MKKCKFCNGNFKLIKKEHLIRTRNSSKSEIIIEDLNTLECTVCGHVELTDSSETYVNFIREKVRKEMSRNSNSLKVNENSQNKEVEKEKGSFSFFKDTIRKWIG